MTEIINTCSEAISLARELERGSAEFYKNLAERNADNRDLFLSFAEENEKYVKQIERTYYGVISDALEGGFAFSLNPEDYALETGLAEKCNIRRGDSMRYEDRRKDHRVL